MAELAIGSACLSKNNLRTLQKDLSCDLNRVARFTDFYRFVLPCPWLV